MARKFLIVVNPGAGAYGHRNLMDRIADFFTKKEVEYAVVYTGKTSDYGLTTHRKSLHEFSDILVVGGDGTISATVDAFHDRLLPISIMPTGTGNDFVKNLGIKKDPEEALKIALDGKIIMSDCGICNGRYFINGVGIGFDGKVVEYMEKKSRVWKGHLAYLSTVVRILAMYKESQVKYSHDHVMCEQEILLMTIANGTTFGGGFVLTPDALIDDGLLDVCLVRAINPFMRFLRIPLLKDGTHGKLKEVDFFNVKEISIAASDLLVAHLDGDYIGHPPFDISIVPRKIPFRKGHNRSPAP
jgi:diacylglycerol kinase (ATP)